MSISIRLSFTSPLPLWTMYTSSPRTDSPISTLHTEKSRPWHKQHMPLGNRYAFAVELEPVAPVGSNRGQAFKANTLGRLEARAGIALHKAAASLPRRACRAVPARTWRLGQPFLTAAAALQQRLQAAAWQERSARACPKCWCECINHAPKMQVTWQVHCAGHAGRSATAVARLCESRCPACGGGSPVTLRDTSWHRADPRPRTAQGTRPSLDSRPVPAGPP